MAHFYAHPTITLKKTNLGLTRPGIKGTLEEATVPSARTAKAGCSLQLGTEMSDRSNCSAPFVGATDRVLTLCLGTGIL